jgi:hypothetical protein
MFFCFDITLNPTQTQTAYPRSHLILIERKKKNVSANSNFLPKLKRRICTPTNHGYSPLAIILIKSQINPIGFEFFPLLKRGLFFLSNPRKEAAHFGESLND